MRVRNFHKLAIIRREARGNTTFVPSKKSYSRKRKHGNALKNKEYFLKTF